MLFQYLNKRANFKKEVRYKQFIMPIVSLVYFVLMFGFINKFYELSASFGEVINNFLNENSSFALLNTIKEFLAGMGVYIALVLLSTFALMIYISIKRFVLAFCKGDFDADRILKNFCKEYISKNDEYYIGKTLVPTGGNMPPNMIALKTKEGVVIHQQQYITIISKDLDFCITTSNRVTFYHRNAQVEDNSTMGNANTVTCLFENINEDLPEETYKEILSELQQKDHLVFYHPDNW